MSMDKQVSTTHHMELPNNPWECKQAHHLGRMIPLNKTEKQTVNCNLARIVQREMEH
jgi:hypothetical protein